MLVRVAGTPLGQQAPLDSLEFVRTIAVARITMPRSMVRLSAGRAEMNDELQALCFFAGANSIFYGEELLTTGNPDVDSIVKAGMAGLTLFLAQRTALEAGDPVGVDPAHDEDPSGRGGIPAGRYPPGREGCHHGLMSPTRSATPVQRRLVEEHAAAALGRD